MLFVSFKKLFAFSRYLHFCLDFWSCRKSGLIAVERNRTREIIFFKNHTENEAGRLVPDLFFSKIALPKVNVGVLQLSLNIFR